MTRLSKQLTYGSAYLLLWLLIGYGGYLGVRSAGAPTCFDNIKNQNEEAVDCGGLCQSCAIKQLLPVRFGPVSHAPMGGETMVFVELQNPNSAFGAERLMYALTFTDASGNVLYTQAEETFIYPSEVKPKIVLGIPVNPTQVSAVTATTTKIVWQPGEAFMAPRVQVREQEVELQPNSLKEFVRGIVKNDNSYNLSRVTIQAVITSGSELLSASKTVVQDLTPGEERFFQIILPLPAGAPRAEITPRLIIEAER
jgi:hypothetical protein